MRSYAATRLRKLELFVAEPQLSILNFKLQGAAGCSLEETDALNVALLAAVHERGNVLLSPFRSVHGRTGRAVSAHADTIPQDRQSGGRHGHRRHPCGWASWVLVPRRSSII